MTAKEYLEAEYEKENIADFDKVRLRDYFAEKLTDFAEQHCRERVEHALKANAELMGEVEKAKELIKKIKEYTIRQSEYCDRMAERDEFNLKTYSKDNMTSEQMSGYYQGRSEGNHGILDIIQDLLKINE